MWLGGGSDKSMTTNFCFPKDIPREEEITVRKVNPRSLPSFRNLGVLGSISFIELKWPSELLLSQMFNLHILFTQDIETTGGIEC